MLTERSPSIRDLHCMHRRVILSYAVLSCREVHPRWCRLSRPAFMRTCWMRWTS